MKDVAIRLEVPSTLFAWVILSEDWFDDCLDSAAEPCIPRDHHMTRLDDSIMEGECIKTGNNKSILIYIYIYI